MGPISLALFATGDDFYATMSAMQYARLCLPISKLVRDYVIFHIYFPSGHLPADGIPRTPLEALKWSVNVRRRDLTLALITARIPHKFGTKCSPTIHQHPLCSGGRYQIVSQQRFYFAIFGNYSRKNSFVTANNRHVFDLDNHVTVPDTKENLMTMYNMGTAMEMLPRIKIS